MGDLLPLKDVFHDLELEGEKDDINIDDGEDITLDIFAAAALLPSEHVKNEHIHSCWAHASKQSMLFLATINAV